MDEAASRAEARPIRARCPPHPNARLTVAALTFALLAPGVAAAAESPGAVAAQQLACMAPPAVNETLSLLQRAAHIERKPAHTSDGIRFFKVRKALTVEGVPVVAVFGRETAGAPPRAEAPGASPELVFGITTAADSATVAHWVRNHPGRFIVADTPSMLGAGLTDIYCKRAPGD